MTQTAGDQSWYEALYVDYEDYDAEPFTQQTQAEVDFVEEHVGGDRSLRILDVGCGTGRHCLELARRGYTRVTGVDLSTWMLQQGRRRAAVEGLPLTFLRMDARRLSFLEAFDVALMLCEGGFSLVETDEMDRQILEGVARALRPGGRLVMTAPNATFMLARLQEAAGLNTHTLREQFTVNKNGAELACTQRYYTYPELKCLLESQKLKQVVPFAVTPEGYRADVMPSPDHFEFGVTAVKERQEEHDG